MNCTPRTEVAPSATARGRILIVEDDQDSALFLTHVLENRGQFEVTHALDPAVALASVVDEPWDLVITDLELPGMHGLELIGALRKLLPRLPVIIVTARESAARDPAVLEAGCPVLFKPLHVEELLLTVAALHRGPSLGLFAGQHQPGRCGQATLARGGH
jgi:DNA-binding response OmpR family regulator